MFTILLSLLFIIWSFAIPDATCIQHTRHSPSTTVMFQETRRCVSGSSPLHLWMLLMLSLLMLFVCMLIKKSLLIVKSSFVNVVNVNVNVSRNTTVCIRKLAPQHLFQNGCHLLSTVVLQKRQIWHETCINNELLPTFMNIYVCIRFLFRGSHVLCYKNIFLNFYCLFSGLINHKWSMSPYFAISYIIIPDCP